MPGLQCARCHRPKPSTADTGGSPFPRGIDLRGLDGEPLDRLVEESWARIHDDEICPQCQTNAEKAEVAGRLIKAIEEEVTRKGDADGPAFEGSLIAFAMRLRDAILHDQTIPHGQEPDRPVGPPLRQLAVAITGAFLTGCPLRIGISEYDQVRAELISSLKGNKGAGWTIEPDGVGDGTYFSGGGFTDELPLVLVSRNGVDAVASATNIFDSRPRREHDRLDPKAQGWALKPTAMRIDVYDLGVAVINGTFDVSVPANLGLKEAADELKQRVWLRPDASNVNSPISEMFRALSRETSRQFLAGVEATMHKRKESAWLSTAEPSASSPDWGRLLWLHPVHLLACGDSATADATIAELAVPFSETVLVPDGRFVPGIGWSAILVDSESARELPMKLLLLHWAYYALYMEIDRGLLAVFDYAQRDRKRPLLRELEDDAEGVFEYYMRVTKARARVDTALNGLGPVEHAVWNDIAGVQKFDALVAGVDRKVEVLQKIADRRVQEASSASNRRSTLALGFLSTLTLVTLAIALLGYFFGGISGKDEAYQLRWGFLAAGLVIAVVLWWVTFRMRPWPRKKTTANPGSATTTQSNDRERSRSNRLDSEHATSQPGAGRR